MKIFFIALSIFIPQRLKDIYNKGSVALQC